MVEENSPLTDELVRAVEHLVEVFNARSIRYALVGGLGIAMRGRPRFTKDVDVLLEVPQIVLPGLLQDLAARGFNFDESTVIREFVREHMSAFSYGKVRIDWLKPVLPLYSRILADASELTWTQDHPVRVATAEGLILTKMVAFRLQDQADIVVLLAANRDMIDIDLIRSEWAPYATSDKDRTAWLDAEIQRIVTSHREGK